MLFLDEAMPKSEAWGQVCGAMDLERAKRHLPPIDEKKCKTKMEALKRHYKKIKDAAGKSGHQTLTWPYFNVSFII